MTHHQTIFLCALLCAAAAAAPALAADEPPGDPRPGDPGPGIPVEGFQQLLPRGAIAALVDPEFVAAAEAEIPDDAWILGFARGGEAYAYDLNILNAHEVVNHEVAGRGFAAVW